MLTFSAESLKELTARIFRAAGTPDDVAALQHVLALEHLLSRCRLHRPATGNGGEEQQQNDERQRQGSDPEAPTPRGPPDALIHHSASQR